MAWLLDTNVLSELRKGERCNASLRHWFDGLDDRDLYTSVLVLGEIHRGIELLQRSDPRAAHTLDEWAETTEEMFANRLLPVTLEICRSWARFDHRRPLPTMDCLIAATALHHRLTLVTRNVADFGDSGVRVFNPFD